jgi:hypothetical protein
MTEHTIRIESTRTALPAAPMAMPEQVLERPRQPSFWRVLFMPWLAWK